MQAYLQFKRYYGDFQHMLQMSYTLVFLLCTPLSDGPQTCEEQWREAGYKHRSECSVRATMTKWQFREKKAKGEGRRPRVVCYWEPITPALSS